MSICVSPDCGGNENHHRGQHGADEGWLEQECDAAQAAGNQPGLPFISVFAGRHDKRHGRKLKWEGILLGDVALLCEQRAIGHPDKGAEEGGNDSKGTPHGPEADDRAGKQQRHLEPVHPLGRASAQDQTHCIDVEDERGLLIPYVQVRQASLTDDLSGIEE